MSGGQVDWGRIWVGEIARSFELAGDSERLAQVQAAVNEVLTLGVAIAPLSKAIIDRARAGREVARPARARSAEAREEAKRQILADLDALDLSVDQWIGLGAISFLLTQHPSLFDSLKVVVDLLASPRDA